MYYPTSDRPNDPLKYTFTNQRAKGSHSDHLNHELQRSKKRLYLLKEKSFTENFSVDDEITCEKLYDIRLEDLSTES